MTSKTYEQRLETFKTIARDGKTSKLVVLNYAIFTAQQFPKSFESSYQVWADILNITSHCYEDYRMKAWDLKIHLTSQS